MLPLALALLLLLLLGLRAAPTRAALGPDFPLYAGPHAVLALPQDAVFITPYKMPSIANGRLGPMGIVQFNQVDKLHSVSETRWGTFFNPKPHKSSNHLQLAGPDPPDIMYIPVPQTFQPEILFHTPHKVSIYFTTPVDRPLPEPETRILGAQSAGPGVVDLVGLIGEPGPDRLRELYVATLSAGSLDRAFSDMVMLQDPVQVVPGPGRSFYISDRESLFRVSASSGSPFTMSLLTPLPGPLDQLVVSRFLSAHADCPDAGDMLGLRPTGQIDLQFCFDGNTMSHSLLAPLPAEASPGGRILAAPAGSLDEAVPWFLYLEPGPYGVLWRGTISLGGIAWQRVLLPSIVSNNAHLPGPGGMHLVRLQMSPGSPGRWVPLVGDVALFDAETFGCDVDPSIVCSAPGTPILLERNWACADDRAMAPFVSAQQLCAGCQNGFYLDRLVDGPPFSHPSHSCRPCAQPGCRTCTSTQCLACGSPLLLEFRQPAGQTACVLSCSSGFVKHAGTCQPAELTSPVGALAPPRPSHFSGLPAGQELTAIVETRLSVIPGTGMPVVPAPSDSAGPAGRNLLLFTRTLEVYLVWGEDVNQADASPPTVIHLLGGGPLPAPVVTYTETATLQAGPSLLLVGLMCLANGQAYQVRLSCQAPGPCTLAAAPVPLPLPLYSCLDIQRLGADLFVIQAPRPSSVYLIQVNVSTTYMDYHELPAGHLAALPQDGGTGRSFTIAEQGTWIVHSGPADAGVMALRQILSTWDSRISVAKDRFLPGIVDFAPVLLPRPAPEPPVLVFTRIKATLWEAAQVPGDMLPAGRSTELPFIGHLLGTLPEALAHELDARFQAVALPDGRPELPAALLLLARGFFGVSFLRCMPGDGPCALLPATFTPLSGALRLAAGAALWQPAIPLVHRAPGQALSLLGFSVATGPVTVDLLSNCPPGLHARPTGECLCHETCAACSDPGTGAFVCDVCRPGFARAPAGASPDRCLVCHDSCLECGLPGDSGACEACPAGAWLHAGACVAGCPAGTWPDSPSRGCVPCPAGCAACAGAAACTACSSRHFLGPDSMCHPCHSSCASCADNATCTECHSGLVFLSPDPQVASLCGSTCAPGDYVEAVRCATCAPSCALCTGAAERCELCADGHFRLTGPPGACAACPAGCASCTADRCLACEPGLFLDSRGACVSACPAGTFADTESCQPCDLSCATCVGGGADQCASCAAGLDFVPAGGSAGTCVSGCPEGQYRDRVSGDCFPCDTACATCNGPSDKDCWRCASGVLQDGDCVQHCAAKHVALAGRCLPCHVSCDQCAGTRSTECLPDCPGDLLALPAGASPMRCVPACPVGYNASGAGCSPCGEHCASCPEQAPTCALCDRGWLLASPDCVAECPAGSSPLGGLCSTCHGSCATCYGPGPDQCLACGPGTPFLVGGRCHAGCPAGTFQDGHACQPCNSTCAACAGPSTSDCTACAAGRLLLGGSCLQQCPDGFFPEGGLCVPCDPTCATCDNPGTCASCGAGRFLSPAGLCVDSCPAGAHACAASGRCLACPAHCAECTSSGASCMPACTGCEEGFLLSDDQCVASCPAGTYSPPELGACAACAASCPTCVERADRCTSCASGVLVRESGTCVPACPPAHAPFEGVCLACPAGCEACQADRTQPPCTVTADGSLACPAVASCSRCAGGLFLVDSASCTAECPSGTFADDEGTPPACAACHANCTACMGPTEADCFEAPKGGASRVGLAVGLSVGLLLLLILLILLVLFCVRRRAKAGLAAPKDLDAEDATMLNTIVELALPGAILDLVRAAWQADPAMRPHAAILRQQCAAFFVAAGGLGPGMGP
ncbi:hypothetical protein H696_03229 [Fonticula alba]|uniref:EGF-like domain-containing protein n=1 Tax=Fonticula alba TaxID=691883 RepID=A0A058Z662_FONAL|nr:hypothetical protein H696_03229 [Fonticula alba]KCV69784.1 hypothetical protein H696_03229 [Fonticula alba]|eukprot:XP_009495390.1 hypothetical protein H696_03229 [Fonticula alba]